VPSPFRFCLRCRTSYEQARGNDFAKLAKLSAEGRSSAMSLITASIVRTLRTWGGDLDDRARKLLAFVDNRQDASLQAGHFNDFVQVTQLRGALYRALDKAPEGLTDEIVAQRVTEELGLAMADFARNPGAKYSQRDEAWRALREVTGYRLYLDLERGWRVTMPNLEQTGLLRIRYRDLPEVAADAEAWQGSHVALREDDPVHREEIAAALLDELRRNLAIDVEYLSDDGFDLVRRLSAQHLKEPWSLPERELPPMAGVAFPGPGPARPAAQQCVPVRPRPVRAVPDPRVRQPRITLKIADAQEIITDLFSTLHEAGLLTVAVPPGEHDVPGYRLRAAVIHWQAGSGLSGAEDRVRRTLDNEEGPRVNPFFRELYRAVAATLAGLRAKEHTAQVPPAERQEREREFSDAALPVLYCSPTMELGVDINALSAVGLRNVPPTPANYAQRAGRAGRSGQPALVVTYCATGNAHDQYYFRRPTDMVGGSVAPPRLDLANEDLVRSHVQAVWLAETGQDLRGSLTDVLDVGGASPTLELLPKVRERLTDPGCGTACRYPGQGRARRDDGEPGQGAVVAGRLDRRCDQPGAAGVRRRLPALAGPVPARAPGVPRPVGPLGGRLGPAQGTRQRRPARPRRPYPADPAQQRGFRRLPDRLLLLPVLRLRGIPARLFLPPPAAGRVHSRPGRPPRRGLHPAAPVHRHRRIRPRRGHLPRGRPLPGRQRGPAARRTGPGRHGHRHRPALPRLRVPASRSGRHRRVPALRRAAARHHPGAAAPDLGADRPPGPDLLR
jgi:hypothetical protein